MPRTQDRLVMTWIIVFGCLASFLVVYGGFVRLTRSGLSIVEWKPLVGTVPPLTQVAWANEFTKYRATPEYLQINRRLTIEQYKAIFLIEWIHRSLARLAGLVFAMPFFVFLGIGRIPLKEAPLYVAMGCLFLAQALMGWIMVSSGLVERPSVSHYLLAAHLFLALALVGLSAWTALGHHYGLASTPWRTRWSLASVVVLVAMVVLLLQIAYGAFTAGLKAGFVSNSWPLMLGHWIPQGLLAQVRPAPLNLIAAPLTVAFIHRWLAFVALLVAVVANRLVVRSLLAAEIRRALGLGMVLAGLQIGLGIAVVVSGVDLTLALLHQLNALCLFIVSVFLLHRFRSRDHSAFRSA
jgi:cytochrome c oxidase assembly protein subunit 15